MDEIQQKLNQALSKIDILEQKFQSHQHNGANVRVNLYDIFGLFQTVSAVPTAVPKSIYDQIKIYINGSTKKLYVYDYTGNAWYSATIS